MRRCSGRASRRAMRPGERLAVDILLQQALAHHQPEIAARPAPGRVGGLVDDMAEIVEPAGKRRLQRVQPCLARMPALPGARGEAEDLDLDAAALERAGENIGAAGRDHDGPPAHRAGIVEQQRDHGVAELGLALLLEGQGMHRIDDDAGKPRRIEHAFLEVEIPAAILLREQPALQPVGESRHRAVQRLRAACRERRASARARRRRTAPRR